MSSGDHRTMSRCPGVQFGPLLLLSLFFVGVVGLQLDFFDGLYVYVDVFDLDFLFGRFDRFDCRNFRLPASALGCDFFFLSDQAERTLVYAFFVLFIFVEANYSRQVGYFFVFVVGIDPVFEVLGIDFRDGGGLFSSSTGAGSPPSGWITTSSWMSAAAS